LEDTCSSNFFITRSVRTSIFLVAVADNGSSFKSSTV